MSKTYVSNALRSEMESYFQGRCAYCQSPQALMNVLFEVDHILPEKAGGLTIQNNLALSCPLCNGYKGGKVRGIDPQTGRNVLLFHPRHQKWPRHFRWADDLQTIEGRTRNGRATVKSLQLNNHNLLRLRSIWLAIGSMPPRWNIPLLIGLQQSRE